MQLVRSFYSSIELPIDDVIARSDLYEKPGKSPHAFCTDIDREGDVRVLANIVENEYWMGTLLHELGHSVYSSKNIPASLPYLLRMESHILTTEGVAMMFERFSKQRAWIEKMGLKVSEPAKAFDEAARKMQGNQLLIFSRWCQVMLRFEKGMYENPDQDLNELWWSLVAKYQGLKKPERPQRAGLWQQDPHRQRAGVLPQLHDGGVVRVSAPPSHRQVAVSRRESEKRHLQRQSQGRRLHEGFRFCAGPFAELECGANEVRDR